MRRRPVNPDTLRWLKDHGYSVRPARESDNFHEWEDGWIVLGDGMFSQCRIDADTLLDDPPITEKQP